MSPFRKKGNIALGALFLVMVGAGLFLLLAPKTQVIRVGTEGGAPSSSASALLTVPESVPPTSTTPVVAAQIDLPNQQPLPNPPTVVRGIYLTGWTAGSPKRMLSHIDFLRRSGLNGVVIDIKDYSGYLAYAADIPLARTSGALGELRIARPNKLIKELHDAGIYVAARVTVFQDPVLAKARPDLALKNASTGALWADRKGLQWLDPAGKETWDYHVAIAKDALARGFDEINFDYIRFASDGDLPSIRYPFWDMKRSRSAVIKEFFAYLRNSLPGAKISADLFGLSTLDAGDLGIGQVIEHAYQNFDFVSPMVYPSHYAAGFIGYKNPALYPYEVIRYSLEAALFKMNRYLTPKAASSTTSIQKPIGKIRPWLQAFDLGAVYTGAMVEREIDAVEDVLLRGVPTSSLPHVPADQFAGWWLWDPTNTYARYGT